jgi:hypothetical protein
MTKAKKTGEVNIYIIRKNAFGEITEEILMATFLNRAWADLFMEAEASKDFYDEYYYLAAREV